MNFDPRNLEPAVRDPKKLRRTAFFLVLIMLAGAILIPIAHSALTKNQSKKSTPSYVSRIVPGRQLDVVLQDGSVKQLPDDSGKVWIVNVSTSQEPVLSARTLRVMERMKAHYTAEDDVTLVTLVLDSGEPEKLKAQLQEEAGKLGAQLPKWWVASQQQETLHKFVKNEFKASLYPHQDNGSWKYDTSIFLIDRNRHIRKGVVPQKRGGDPFVASFDFDQAADWDQRGIKTGTESTNQEELERLLVATVDTLLSEGVEVKSDIGWVFGLIAVICLLILGVAMWIRHGRRSATLPPH